MIVLLLLLKVYLVIMRDLSIKIKLTPGLYLKDPDSTELGKRIISNSIVLINELGFEKFTFKKLSKKINSPESSIYRYFENKHLLLIYLTSWYWSWIEYRVVLSVININNNLDKLDKAIDILTMPVNEDKSFSYINEVILDKIIIAESVKSFHTKEVDVENKKGCFESYKKLVTRLAQMILDVNPDYKYPHMLITTVIEGAHQQRYFSEHLPKLTDTIKTEDTIVAFYKELVQKMISSK